MFKSHSFHRPLGLLSVASLCGVLGAGHNARAQDATQVRNAPSLTSKQIFSLAQNASRASIVLSVGQANLFEGREETLSLRSASVDDALIAMGDAADLTVMMDAAQPRAAARVSITRPTKLSSAWQRMAQHFHLAYSQSDERTLLMWNSPSPEAVLRVAKQVAAGDIRANPLVPAQEQGPPYLRRSADLREVATSPADPLLVDLLLYLRKAGIADGLAFSKNLPVSDLPEELRARIVARARASTSATAPSAGNWSQPNWKQARLSLSRPINTDRTNPAYLLVSGAFGGL